MQNSDWLCIECGVSLGKILGGEYHPSIHGKYLRTKGPNLVVECPDCGRIKTFYTAYPVVRAMYQLVDAISSVAAKAMIEQIGKMMHSQEKN